MNNKAVAVAFILIAVMLGLFGYKESRPTGLEGFAAGLGEFVAAVDEKQRDRIHRDLRNFDSERYKRGMPFWIIGGLFAIAGIAFLTRNEQDQERRP